MDALRLYNLESTPKQEKVYSLPKKKAKFQPVITNQEKVKYTCYICKKQVKISASEVVSCSFCQSRIVYKEPKKGHLVYKSV